MNNKVSPSSVIRLVVYLKIYLENTTNLITLGSETLLFILYSVMA
jgi:hypothetical protein